MITSVHTEIITYPFNRPDGLELDDAYAKARAQPGMIRVRLPHGEPAWLATRYADARLVLADRRFSRAAAAQHDEPRQSPGRVTEGMLSMDPPGHTRLRTLVAKAFTGQRVERLRPRIRQLAEEIIEEFVSLGAPADLVENFALPLPVAVICELLGVPVADRPRFRMWSDAVMSTAQISAEEFQANRQEFRAYMKGLIDLRRAEPADDLMTALLQARDQRDRLSEVELLDLCGGILIAGHETTATQIPNFVHLLLEEPPRWARLRAEPDLIPTAVEELMRFVPLGVGAGFARYATVDVEVGGALVRAGEAVLVALGAANRDAAHFDAPEELRLDRQENQHIGFGHGLHHCLGAQLARAELQEALRVLVTRLPDLRVAGEVVWKTQMLLRGPRIMPVAW